MYRNFIAAAALIVAGCATAPSSAPPKAVPASAAATTVGTHNLSVYLYPYIRTQQTMDSPRW
jgi:hypothetical protein